DREVDLGEEVDVQLREHGRADHHDGGRHHPGEDRAVDGYVRELHRCASAAAARAGGLPPAGVACTVAPSDSRSRRPEATTSPARSPSSTSTVSSSMGAMVMVLRSARSARIAKTDACSPEPRTALRGAMSPWRI